MSYVLAYECAVFLCTRVCVCVNVCVQMFNSFEIQSNSFDCFQFLSMKPENKITKPQNLFIQCFVLWPNMAAYRYRRIDGWMVSVVLWHGRRDTAPSSTCYLFGWGTFYSRNFLCSLLVTLFQLNFPFAIDSIVVVVVVFALHRYVIESPRWLISKKRFRDAITQFKKIAKINGRQFDMSEKELEEIYKSTQQEVTYGIASLFSGWRLARNTAIMGFSW